MGMVNRVVPHAELERTALDWGRRIVAKSPTAQRMLKYSFNLIDDGLVGQQLFAGETTRLAYMADEAVEGRDAFLEKRDPDFGRVPMARLSVYRIGVSSESSTTRAFPGPTGLWRRVSTRQDAAVRMTTRSGEAS